MAPLRSASGPPPPYLTAAASPYTVPHAAHPSFALPLPAFGQGSMVRTGAGSLLQLQPGPASAIAFQPFTSWSPSQLPAEGDIRRAVRSAIRQSSDPLGASIQDIDRSCRGFNLVEIRQATRRTQRMGHTAQPSAAHADALPLLCCGLHRRELQRMGSDGAPLLDAHSTLC